MSIAMTKAVWEGARVSGGALLVLLALADHADDEGKCWPSSQRLGEMVRLDRRSVIRHLRTLEDAGCLVTDQRPGRSSPVAWCTTVIPRWGC